MVKHNNTDLWYDEKYPLSTGCGTCPDLSLCGGLRIETQPENCMCFCQRDPKNPCAAVCKCNTKTFVARLREVGGWELVLSKTRRRQAISLPSCVPMIRSKSKRSYPLKEECIAIPLRQVMSTKTGLLRVRSREELCSRFLIDFSAKIILSGVHTDPFLESYWEKGRRAPHFIEGLAALEVDLVTTPNFSVFPNVPRWDNFHNMKRIAICWHELAAAGLPAALHINGRTNRDFERWTDFVIEHDEVTVLSFEFQTGPGIPERAPWYVKELNLLARKVERPLSIVIHGGINYFGDLRQAYDQVALITSTPALKASHFQQLDVQPNFKLCSHRATRNLSRDMDMLLKHNIAAYGRLVCGKNPTAA